MANNFVFKFMAEKDKCLFDIIFEELPNGLVALGMSTIVLDLPPASKISYYDTSSFAEEISKNLKYSVEADEDAQKVVNLSVFMVVFLNLVQARLGAGFQTKEFNRMLKLTEGVDLTYLRSTNSGRIRLFPKSTPEHKYESIFYLDSMTFDVTGLFEMKQVQNGEFYRFTGGTLNRLDIFAVDRLYQELGFLVNHSQQTSFVDESEPKVYFIH